MEDRKLPRKADSNFASPVSVLGYRKKAKHDGHGGVRDMLNDDKLSARTRKPSMPKLPWDDV